MEFAPPRMLTLDEFRQLEILPENSEKILELIDGEVVEKVASFTPSQIAALIGTFINLYLFQNPIGYVTGADGSYIINNRNVLNPDVGYISRERLPERPAREVPVPPDFAVEVMSPTDRKRQLRQKAERYIEAGTRLVWLIFPEEGAVEVYTPDDDVRVFGISDTLDGGAVLPGFTLPVRSIFPEA